MAQPILYHCAHLETPRAPLPAGYVSSFADFAPLDRLYFCEECDAIRCEGCVGVEVASYFCPNCLFDVPGSNVRGDKNSCARSCFSCPRCCTSLTGIGTDIPGSLGASSREHTTGPPYFLICPSCKWSSREIGWLFDKPSALASQLPKVYTQPEQVQSEFDALKDHLEKYVQQSAPPSRAQAHKRTPSRHIAQLTQAAQRALRRDVPGLARRRAGVPRKGEKIEKAGWDELAPYTAKSSWRQEGLERGTQDVDDMMSIGGEDVATLDKRWASSSQPAIMSSETVPQRIRLQTKLTKRCPHPTCRSVLIQPDTKSIRMLVKNVAATYLPAMELGRRRCRPGEELPLDASEEDWERRRRERRRTRANLPKEVDQDLSDPLRPGEVYTFQLAFTNPLYDPIQIRLGTAHQARHAVPVNHHVHIPTAHFTVGALKEAWAYDDEDEDDTGAEADDSAADEARKSSRLSLGGSSLRHRSTRDVGVEKKANVTKVGLEVEVRPGADKGPVEFDLEVRFTYRADEDGSGGKEEYKTFTFWVRVCAGNIA
ncbi:hypothetical protein Q8F55_004255 [Vanrija albida]|uniref:Dynactin subunit 4 n=1 Tax=Vanrija albida TaxID=181172 RepID=A0ABR3Q677_9TREE